MRTHPLQIILTEQEKELLINVSKLSGLSQVGFLRNSFMEKAHKIYRENNLEVTPKFFGGV